MFIPDATLDFHDLGPITPFDTEKILFEFLEDSYIKEFMRIPVITGKGLNSQNGAKLRPLIKKLLEENQYVQKFKTAGFDLGGEGAFEVTLKTD
ncbi:MAG: Smr/MutS family protein [bacterium]